MDGMNKRLGDIDFVQWGNDQYLKVKLGAELHQEFTFFRVQFTEGFINSDKSQAFMLLTRLSKFRIGGLLPPPPELHR